MLIREDVTVVWCGIYAVIHWWDMRSRVSTLQLPACLPASLWLKTGVTQREVYINDKTNTAVVL